MSPLPSADIPAWIPMSAGVWLLTNTWLGWRRGVVRQAASLLGLILATTAGFWLGPFLSPVVPPMGLPNFLRPVLAGIFIGVVISATVSLFSHIIFRKTEDQGLGIIRLAYGITGGALGLIYGLAVLGLAAWGIRFFGSFAEGLHKGASDSSARIKGSPPAEPAPLVLIKKAMEETSTGDLLRNIDPLPQGVYQRIHKIGEVFTNPSAKERFLADPSMDVFSKNSKILALKTDPELQDALRDGDVWAVLRNPKVQLAAADTQLLTTLRTVDLDKLLDRALASPVSGGVPMHATTDKTSPPRTGTGRAKP